MKSFKKALRLLVLILLIVLASAGIGLAGGVPIPPLRKKEDTTEIRIELPEPSHDDKASTHQINIKQE